MRATIKDVSFRAGVSVTTVSRVLNKEPYVREEVRLKVEAAVEALNFRRSRAARALAGQRSFQIALIYDNPSPYYIYTIQSGVRACCSEHGFRVIFQEFAMKSPTLAGDIAALIDETHLDGVILAPPLSDSPEILSELARRELPFVRIAPGDNLDLSSFVHMDDEAAAEELTDHLVGLGHRDIGFVIGYPGRVGSEKRLQGYRRAMAKHGLRVRRDRLIQGTFTFDSGYEAGLRILSRKTPPSAVFASNDDMAAGVLAAAHELGFDVPRDVAVAGFDDTDLARAVWPPLTTIRQPIRELAYAAAKLLLEGVTQTGQLLDYTLVVRGSTLAR